jgi:signal transduction histidine kinase
MQRSNVVSLFPAPKTSHDAQAVTPFGAAARVGTAEARCSQPRWVSGGDGSTAEDASVRRVAVIDDDDDVRDALCEVLRDQGFEAQAFSDAESALLAFEQQTTPDAIVLDLMMPGMDGWTFRVAQRQHAKLRQVPVVVVTASDSAQARAIDADAILHKPVSADELGRVVERVLARAERRRLLARGLGMLVTSVAHEVNNPLTAISGALGLALLEIERGRAPSDDALSLRESVHHHLLTARDATDHIIHVMRDLLTFARPSPRNAQGNERADVGRAVQAAVRLGEAVVKQRGGVLRVSIGELPLVEGDEPRLAQVFLNLIVNAAHALRPGEGVERSIELRGRTHGASVEVEIEDSGTGIASSDLPHIFEPFFTTKRAGGGTGIGLTLSRQIVERVGGTLEVRSTLGRGTTFVITLRAAPPSMPPPPPS